MESLINIIKNDENVKNDIIHEVVKFRNSNYITKEKIGEVYMHKAKIFEKVLKIAGDEIYDLDTENTILREQIGETIDEDFIKEQMKLTKFQDTNEDKNKKILNRLQRRLQQMKSIE